MQTAALYFDAPWSQALTADTGARTPFILADGSTHEVKMLRNVGGCACLQNANLTAADIGYSGGAVSLLILMPIEPLPEYRATLDANALESVLRDLSRQDVSLSLPLFSATTQPDLIQILMGMGLSLSLTKDAQFTIFTTQEEKIQAVYEQGTITVDENGTRAAAAAAVVGATAGVAESPPPALTIDHPFLYFIHDSATNTVLFAGQVGDPSQN